MKWYYYDGTNQVGPIEEAQLLELYRSGAITGETLVWREGLANWARFQEVGPAVEGIAPLVTAAPVTAAAAAPMPVLGSDEAVCAECGQIFPKQDMITHGQAFVCAACKPTFVQKLAEGVAIRPSSGGFAYVTEEQLLARDYQVDIGGCFTRAWEVFKTNAGMAIAVVLVAGAILFFGGLVSNLIAVAVPLGNVIVPLLYTAPLLGGLYWFFIRLIRGEPAVFGDSFAGFARRYVPLLVYGILETLLTYIFLVPAFLVGVGFVFIGNESPEKLSPAMLPMFLLAMVFFMIGVIYVSTTLTFAAQLIIDKGYAFWPAMRLSFRLVHRRWWMTFGFMFVGGLVLLGGALLCGIGLLVAVPVYLAMRGALYDDNFRDLLPQG